MEDMEGSRHDLLHISHFPQRPDVYSMPKESKSRDDGSGRRTKVTGDLCSELLVTKCNDELLHVEIGLKLLS